MINKMKNKAIGGFLKRIMSVLTSVAKAKTLALKNKTSALRTRLIIFSLLRDKKQLVMSSSAISHKLQALLLTVMGQGHGAAQLHEHDHKISSSSDHQEEDNMGVGGDCRPIISSQGGAAIVLYNHRNKYNLLPISSTHPTTSQFHNDDQHDSTSTIGVVYSYEEDNQDGEEKVIDIMKYPDLVLGVEEEEDIPAGGSVIDLVKNSKQELGEEFRLEDEIDHVADLFIKRFHRQMRLQKQLSLQRYQEMLPTQTSP